MKNRVLVAYFSASGTTKGIAKKLAKASDADLFEIKPEVSYTKADLDWTNNKSRSSDEMQNSSFRPNISEKLNNMNDYDTVFLGFPIWWHVLPQLSIPFLKAIIFSGKR